LFDIIINDIILINKIDLKPYVDFNDKFFYDGVRAQNNKAPIFEVSGKSGEGIEEVAAWLINQKN